MIYAISALFVTLVWLAIVFLNERYGLLSCDRFSSPWAKLFAYLWLGGFMIVALTLGYWQFFRQDDLLARDTNPRIAEEARRVVRGREQLRHVLDSCCTFERDCRGNVVDYDPKPDRTVCRDCGDR